MLKMMSDTSRITHTRSGKNNLRHRIKVDCSRLLCAYAESKLREAYRIDAFLDQTHEIIIKALERSIHKYIGRLDCERAVDINRKTVMSFDKLLILDLLDKIQELLSTSYRKRRNDHISLTVKCLLNDTRKILYMIYTFFMET